MIIVIIAVSYFLPAFLSRKKVKGIQNKILKNQVEDIPSAATLHALSRQTAQVSASSEEVVEDCNPHSLLTIVKIELCTTKTFSTLTSP